MMVCTDWQKSCNCFCHMSLRTFLLVLVISILPKKYLPVLVHIYQTVALTVFLQKLVSGPMVIQSILTSRHYARSVGGQFMLAKAMERLLWKAFMECNEIQLV